MSAIVSFEATGPYEENLADECLAAGVSAVRLDAWKTRKYAESQGMLEKTDAIDCEMIRDFAASLRPEQLRFVRPMSDGYRRLKRATRVRRNLIKAKTLVVNQLENILVEATARPKGTAKCAVHGRCKRLPQQPSP